MPVQIHNLRSRIELLRQGEGANHSVESTPGDAGDTDLKEALRPLVLELLEEELDRHLRSQG